MNSETGEVAPAGYGLRLWICLPLQQRCDPGDKSTRMMDRALRDTALGLRDGNSAAAYGKGIAQRHVSMHVHVVVD